MEVIEVIKEERIGFVVKPEFKKELKETAAETGIPMSEICRQAIRKEVRDLKKASWVNIEDDKYE